MQVYPDQEATAVVVFSPPAGSATRSGTFPFGVRAESVVDAGTSAVAEGDLEIGRVFGLQAKLTPVTSSGRWRGKHFIELTNWGNAPVRLKLTAGDPDEKLAFLVGPEILDLPLGVTGHAQLRVKTKSPFLRGTPVRLPFQLVAEPDPPETPTGPPSPMMPDPRRATMDGAFSARADPVQAHRGGRPGRRAGDRRRRRVRTHPRLRGGQRPSWRGSAANAGTLRGCEGRHVDPAALAGPGGNGVLPHPPAHR